MQSVRDVIAPAFDPDLRLDRDVIVEACDAPEPPHVLPCGLLLKKPGDLPGQSDPSLHDMDHHRVVGIGEIPRELVDSGPGDLVIVALQVEGRRTSMPSTTALTPMTRRVAVSAASFSPKFST